MKPKVLILIVGSLRPGFVESIKSWEPVIDLFDNAEILYVLRDRINLMPERLLNIRKQNPFGCRQFCLDRLFGKNNNLFNFIKDTSIIFDIPEDLIYSPPICESFLFETLPFFKTKRCFLHKIDNIQDVPYKNMFYSWKSASDYILANNINFDYCIKIRPDLEYKGNPKDNKFKHIFDYCVQTNNIVLDALWAVDPPSNQKLNKAGDNAAIGSRENIMKYLQIIDHNIDGEECSMFECHGFLFYYLFKNKITMANGSKYIRPGLKSWKLQDNIYFKQFLKDNKHIPHYEDFLTLLNQLSTSS